MVTECATIQEQEHLGPNHHIIGCRLLVVCGQDLLLRKTPQPQLVRILRVKDLFKRDVAPFSAAPSIGAGTIIVVLIVALILLSLLSKCSSCDPKVENCSSSYRSSGGSFGGFSGGGGHK